MTLEQQAIKLLEKIKKENPKINAILEVNPNLVQEAKILDKKTKKGKLYGKFIGVKSNINVLGLTASCASKTLENYSSTFDATVIEKIKAEDGLIVGMLNCDEFACGVSGETSAFGPAQNPSCQGYVPGGSSSGSAAAVAAGFCDISLGSDTGGSIRVPASFCGLVGVKPSYGLVSRYGLIDLSMSLDQIGPIAKSVEDATLLLDIIKGKDERDTTTFNSNPIKLSKLNKIKVGIVKVQGVDSRIENLVSDYLKKFNLDLKKVEIKYIDLAIQTYHPIVWTEFFSATRRFDGRKYGKKIEDSAGPEVLRRITGGSIITKAEFAGRYYHKALQVKSLIKQEFEQALSKVDCLIMPTVPVLPWQIGKKLTTEQYYATDALVIPANLAEVCAISIPIGTISDQVKKPVGLQIICAKGQESKMLSIAKQLELP